MTAIPPVQSTAIWDRRRRPTPHLCAIFYSSFFVTHYNWSACVESATIRDVLSVFRISLASRSTCSPQKQSWHTQKLVGHDNAPFSWCRWWFLYTRSRIEGCHKYIVRCFIAVGLNCMVRNNKFTHLLSQNPWIKRSLMPWRFFVHRISCVLQDMHLLQLLRSNYVACQNYYLIRHALVGDSGLHFCILPPSKCDHCDWDWIRGHIP